MKILSWNMLCSNRKFDISYSFLKNSNADIICLQEVPHTFLARLSTLPYHLAHAPEVDRIEKGSRVTQYVVILSRYPIVESGLFALTGASSSTSARATLFTSLMFSLRLWERGVGNRHGVYADLKLPDGSMLRAICVHLSLTTPAQRAEEFTLVTHKLHTSNRNVVAGDFNVIDSRRLSVLNWFLGGPLRSALFPHEERADMEQKFALAGLANPLIGQATHPLSAAQLDHILVPAGSHVRSATVIHERYGSDHNPIIVETT